MTRDECWMFAYTLVRSGKRQEGLDIIARMTAEEDEMPWQIIQACISAGWVWRQPKGIWMYRQRDADPEVALRVTLLGPYEAEIEPGPELPPDAVV